MSFEETLRERLRQQATARDREAGAGDHPDADLLTAFVERTLQSQERAWVISHLADCSACREVVALAWDGEQPADLAQAVAPARSGWGFSPMRWGLVAAGVIVAVAVTVVPWRERMQESDRTATYAQPEQRAQAKAAQEADQKASEPAAVTAPVRERASVADAEKDRAKKETPAGTAKGKSELYSFGAEYGRAGGVGTGESIARKDAQPSAPAAGPVAQPQPLRDEMKVAAAPPPPPPAGEADSAAKQKAAAPVAVPPANEMAVARQQVRELAVQQNAPAAAMTPSTGARVAKSEASPAEPAAADEVRAESSAKSTRVDRLSMKRPADATFVSRSTAQPVQWSLSPAGTLLQSADGGSTWVEVPLARGVRLRAINTVGESIWLGGSGGTLYHSSNAGKGWRRVGFPSQEDVVRISFESPQSGVVTTASGAKFSTTDGGATWKPVP